jgi:hypothetical protein
VLCVDNLMAFLACLVALLKRLEGHKDINLRQVWAANDITPYALCWVFDIA